MKSVTLAGRPAPGLYDLRGEYVHGRPPNSAPIEVENPYNHAEKILVYRSLIRDPLAALEASGHITNPQYLAGRHWQKCYDLATIGGARAIDPTREAVDGGRIPDPSITYTQRRAMADLAVAARRLGQEGESIVQDVLARGLSLAGVANRRGMQTQRERDYIGRRFREALDTLAELFGYSITRDY